MASTTAVAHTNDYPKYSFDRAEDAYVDGYTPVSLLASHSSLLTNKLWIGFGLILSSMAGFYAFITGLANQLVVKDEVKTAFEPSTLTMGGGILALVCLVVGFALVSVSRKEYHAYVKRTGNKA